MHLTFRASASTKSTSRQVATCAMALVMVVTLLWGGCLSCSQYFMFPKAIAKHCCLPTGHCKNVPARQTEQQCNRQAMALVHQQPILDHATNVVTIPDVIVLSALLPVGPIELVATVSHAPPPDIGQTKAVLRI